MEVGDQWWTDETLLEPFLPFSNDTAGPVAGLHSRISCCRNLQNTFPNKISIFHSSHSDTGVEVNHQSSHDLPTCPRFSRPVSTFVKKCKEIFSLVDLMTAPRRSVWFPSPDVNPLLILLKPSLGLYCGTTLVLGWLCNSGILAGGLVIKMRLHQVLLLLSAWWELRETYESLTNSDKIEPNRISKKRNWSDVDWRYRSIWSSLKRSVKKTILFVVYWFMFDEHFPAVGWHFIYSLLQGYWKI